MPQSTRLAASCSALLAAATLAVGTTIIVPSEGIKTISQAMAKAKKGDTVSVSKGVYRESFSVAPAVVLLSQEPLGASIRGSGAEKVVALSNSCTVQDFEISGGTIGVYSSAQGNTIKGCLIHGNSQTGIMCVGHLPKLEDNIIVYNEGSGLQGWDVRSTISSVSHNTIAFNGNHGISLGGNSQVAFENNIIAFNEKIGMKVAPSVKATLKRNCFFGNTEIIESFPSDNFAFDPMFVAPRKMDFALSNDSRCNNMGTDNQDIGARFNH